MDSQFTYLDPVDILFSQETISVNFRDKDRTIFDTRDELCNGLDEQAIPTMRVVEWKRGTYVALDNRRLAVFKMVRHAGKCRRIKTHLISKDIAKPEFRVKARWRESIKVRGCGPLTMIFGDGSTNDEQ
eukprot:219649-Amphidinium_carterae.1